MTLLPNPPPAQHAPAAIPRIVGRSSSHFTRIVRMFAVECDVSHTFEIVPDLLCDDASAYGGNPGLRLPNLITPGGTSFGALNSCRVLHQLASRPIDVLWPENLAQGTLANTQELVLQAMSTEVTLILSTSQGAHSSPYTDKLMRALTNTLDWLEANVLHGLDALPPRATSYLEVSLFCLLDHLEFRRVASLSEHPNLQTYRRRFAQRPSALATCFEFDV